MQITIGREGTIGLRIDDDDTDIARLRQALEIRGRRCFRLRIRGVVVTREELVDTIVRSFITPQHRIDGRVGILEGADLLHRVVAFQQEGVGQQDGDEQGGDQAHEDEGEAPFDTAFKTILLFHAFSSTSNL